ncbi:helix-turn-helix domain-containing protein [Sulfitobacter mediterraneus]|uniref:helix-turn-helix domain-containing protein n=1 Tax=Sulfitobacter mediterraneus TaxID=83219 RepID=UPI0021A42400|nr:helix-turn-helix domain-containing protein [Sulfitobacter mediterraneus]UWR13424.1 helix-turn-helix domain-containing protein [Sulfitobacter mediterraneus]
MEFVGASVSSVPRYERHFYKTHKAFGRFGMRIFEPTPMELPHWHGHVEVNLLTGGDMTYEFDNQKIDVSDGEPVVFWAGIPHQLSDLRPKPRKKMRLANLYVPADSFLTLPHIASLQVALLGGGMARLSRTAITFETMDRWFSDYRSGEVDRSEMLKMEVNTILRRAIVEGLDFKTRPVTEEKSVRRGNPGQIQHVVAMVRFVLENLSQPISNGDVTKLTGLHENYALSLFSRTMRISLKKFIIRMRLIRARAALVERTDPITTIAFETGFTSISQFYEHFTRNYGMTPNAIRHSHSC